MKGIVLAGGTGSRLWPLTHAISKQMLPVYDKPMIYYPLSVLMFSGIREILIITTEKDCPFYEKLLGDGSKLGLEISYRIQSEPKGIADAFLVGESFIDGQPVALILGDNLFYGDRLPEMLSANKGLEYGAKIYAYHVSNPSDYGVVSFSRDGVALTLEEKPLTPKSSYAVPGLYFYDSQVVEIAKHIRPSSRGELEITDVNRHYLEQKSLQVEVFGRGMAWLDTGTPDNLFRASEFVRVVEQRQGWKIACIEEVAYRVGFIDDTQLRRLGEDMAKSSYGQYLLALHERDNA
ncbi:MAG: glucose-1-phosphate thymidylyltransferase [Legionellales bacterium]|nr:glucose-1-phosphate thymidylyltransferase [Legionellales bacterium]